MRLTACLLLPPLLLVGLSACGGSDDAAAPTTSAAPSSAPPTPSPSGLSSQEAQTVGIEAQGVGIQVGAWSVKNDFAIPADDAAFQDDVDYADQLSEGEKASYRKISARRFEVCVTKFDGSTALAWGIYHSDPGDNSYGVGAPTQDFCP